MPKFSRLNAFFSLGTNVNKVKGQDDDFDQEDGVISDFQPELKLDTEDSVLIELSKQWTNKWEKYNESHLKGRQKKAQSYWEGKLPDELGELTGDDKPKSDNLIFEALETFLPVATKQKPEPFISSDETPEGEEFVQLLQKVLMTETDTLKLKLKTKQVTRHWALYFVGIMKIGWNEKTDDIILKTIRPQKLILDPDSIIEESDYQGEYVGEYREETAADLINRFKNKKEFIKGLVRGKMGTLIKYVEWWTDDMLFWTLKDEVLDKIKNPHWNFDDENRTPRMIKETFINEFNEEVETEVEEKNESGEVIEDVEIVKGKNHFPHSKKPYVFLSVYNLGDRPHDNTSLIEQNFINQDRINKRQIQINKNVDNMNGGWVVSLAKAGFSTKEQASQVVKSLRSGGAVAIPAGSPSEAIQKITGNSLPPDVFNSLQDARNELRGVFGITGLSPQGTQKEKTVRGKIIFRGQDGDRISGGITEYLEQFYDLIYNWMVQMVYVYYDQGNFISLLGEEDGLRLQQLIETDFTKRLIVSVKEGSLIPRDNLTKRNEAVDLWTAGAISPLDLHKRLEDPNPEEATKNLLLWQQGQLPQELQGGQLPTQQEIPNEQLPIQQGPLPEQSPALSNVPV